MLKISRENIKKKDIINNISFNIGIPISYSNLILNDLIKICTQNREVKLKFELEKNVNLVSFEKNRLEISFNDNLDKNFVKDLSLKLFEWTGERWIISFSKSIGEISIREKENNKKIELLKNFQNSELYKHVREKFPDANLVEIIPKKEHDE